MVFRRCGDGRSPPPGNLTDKIIYYCQKADSRFEDYSVGWKSLGSKYDGNIHYPPTERLFLFGNLARLITVSERRPICLELI